VSLYLIGQMDAQSDHEPRWTTDPLWVVLPPAYRLGYVDARIHA
jgi:hypothetical protein